MTLTSSKTLVHLKKMYPRQHKNTNIMCVLKNASFIKIKNDVHKKEGSCQALVSEITTKTRQQHFHKYESSWKVQKNNS